MLGLVTAEGDDDADAQLVRQRTEQVGGQLEGVVGHGSRNGFRVPRSVAI